MQYDVCIDLSRHPFTIWEVDEQGQQHGPKWISHGLYYRHFRLECEELTHRLGVGSGLKRFDIFEEITTYEDPTAYRRQFICGYGKLFFRDWEMKASLFGSDTLLKYFVHIERSSNLGSCGAMVRGYSLDEGDSIHFLIRISYDDFDALVSDIDRRGRGNIKLFFDNIEGVYETAFDDNSSAKSPFQLKLLTSRTFENAKKTSGEDIKSYKTVSVLGKLDEYEMVSVRTLGGDPDKQCSQASVTPEEERDESFDRDESSSQKKLVDFAGGSAGKGGESMMRRLGDVLGWGGNILGLVCLGLGLVSTEWFGQAMLIGGGVVVFLVGRALRYVFAGTLA